MSDNIKNISADEYKQGVQSGSLLHVFDKQTNSIKLIQRDGCYSPNRLNQMINVDSRAKAMLKEMGVI